MSSDHCSIIGQSCHTHNIIPRYEINTKRNLHTSRKSTALIIVLLCQHSHVKQFKYLNVKTLNRLIDRDDVWPSFAWEVERIICGKQQCILSIGLDIKTSEPNHRDQRFLSASETLVLHQVDINIVIQLLPVLTSRMYAFNLL